MSQRNQSDEHALDITSGRSGWWGAFAGVIAMVFVAVPLSAAIGLATHPATQTLFSGERITGASQAGYSAFWWIVAIVLLALPFGIGFLIARASSRALAVVGAIVVLFVIAVIVLGQLFVF
ncbi:hypothetical protein [Agromyces sp. SYSU T00194]|uniref:hypothetical protein n=1 Tax=Agromyces chitinivorans TaxID=3158560 RepID=UPI0033958395